MVFHIIVYLLRLESFDRNNHKKNQEAIDEVFRFEWIFSLDIYKMFW
jgi:hypothetical protein